MSDDNYRSSKSVQKCTNNKYQNLIRQRIHILSWIPTYNRTIFFSDIIAGVTLGLTIIPQSIAYAALAGIPSQYGLYSAFIGSIIYVFFGSIKEVSIGPTALQSLLTLQFTYGKPVEFTIMLTFLAGCVELLMAALRLGFIVDFISTPVTSAFTSATSIIIVVSQLKGIFGISYSSKGIIDTIWQLFTHIRTFQGSDFLIGIGACLLLTALREIKDLSIERAKFKKALWYLSISRNALAILFTSIIAFILIQTSQLTNYKPFALSGKVEKGLPKFQIPDFTINSGNYTYSFIEICTELGSGIIIVPIVAVLANVAIAKSFSSGKVVDATQEMMTLGICNIIGSCFMSMPTSGAFTRSAVSHASGVKTPLAGLYTGILTILALSLLTPYFYYIPKATLSAVLICAVIHLIDFNLAKVLWQHSRRDFYAWLVCFIVCILLGVEIGLVCGVVVNIIYLLFLWSRPIASIEVACFDSIKYIRVLLSTGLFFPGIDNLREKIYLTADDAHKLPVVVDCHKVTGLDYTSAKGIELLANDLTVHHQTLVILNMEIHLQKLIANTENILFCNVEQLLKELLLNEHLEYDRIPLMCQKEVDSMPLDHTTLGPKQFISENIDEV